jgi:hypothetical protein
MFVCIYIELLVFVCITSSWLVFDSRREKKEVDQKVADWIELTDGNVLFFPVVILTIEGWENV